MLFFLLVILAIEGKGQFRRSCGDGVFCPSYDEGGEVMCCRGGILVKEDGLFFERSCCTVDQWLEGEVRLRGEVLWLEEEGDGRKGEDQKDVLGPEVEFQGEGGLVEGSEVQSFILDQQSDQDGSQGSNQGDAHNRSDLRANSVDQEDVTAGLQDLTVTSQFPKGLHEVTTEVQTATATVQQDVSESQQDNQDNADIVEDIEDKLEEVEDEQKSIREHVHRVTSWNEVVLGKSLGRFSSKF